MTAGRTIVSNSQDWSTPRSYVEAVKRVFGGSIRLDPCSNPYSLVEADVEYLLPDMDGLSESWNYETIYVNPPYGSDRQRGTRINNWLAKCLDAHRQHGSQVIALVPVATNTGHWKRYVWGQANAIAFLYDTRLKFLVNGKDEGTGAPMSCAMIYWGNNIDCFSSVFRPFGAVVDITLLIGQSHGLAHYQSNKSNKSSQLPLLAVRLNMRKGKEVGKNEVVKVLEHNAQLRLVMEKRPPLERSKSGE